MPERQRLGVLDTSVLIDLGVIYEDALPRESAISVVPLAQLSQGPHLATTAQERAVRLERLQVAEVVFRARLPFEAAAARRYGTLGRQHHRLGTCGTAGKVRPPQLRVKNLATSSATGLGAAIGAR